MKEARGDQPSVDDTTPAVDPDPAVAELESGPPFDAEPPQPIQPIRRRSSTASGSILAAAMLGLRDVLEGPKKEKIVIQAEVPGEPPDIDKLGLQAELEDGSLAVGPPLDALKDQAAATRRSPRSRRRRRP
jgi:hypothetical protein